MSNTNTELYEVAMKYTNEILALWDTRTDGVVNCDDYTSCSYSSQGICPLKVARRHYSIPCDDVIVKLMAYINPEEAFGELL